MQATFQEHRSNGCHCCRITSYALATICSLAAGIAGLLLLYRMEIVGDVWNMIGFGCTISGVLGFACIILACKDVPVVEAVLSSLTLLTTIAACGLITNMFVNECDGEAEDCLRNLFDIDADQVTFGVGAFYTALIGPWLAFIFWLIAAITACCSINRGSRWTHYEFHNAQTV